MVESQSRKVFLTHAIMFAVAGLIAYLILRLMGYGLEWSVDKYSIDLKSLSISSTIYYLSGILYFIFVIWFIALLYLTIRSIIFLICGSRLGEYWLRILVVIWIICLITGIRYALLSHNYIYISSSIFGFSILGYGIYHLEKYYYECYFDK